MSDVGEVVKITKEKQYFKTTDLFGLILLVLFVTLIVVSVAFQTLRADDRPMRARGMVESLAQQIKVQQFDFNPSSRNSRRPAAEERKPLGLSGSGLIGRDPWGNPFHYNVRKTEPTLESRAKAWIYVWSDGPNRGSNAAEFELKQAQGGFQFGANEIGYALEVLSE